MGLLINGEVNPNGVILGYWTGAFTAGTGLWGTMGVNAASGAISSYLKGDDPLKGGAISGAASGLGYGAGKLVELPLDKVLNPMKPWKDWLWVDVGMGISKPLPINPVPGLTIDIISALLIFLGLINPVIYCGKFTHGIKVMIVTLISSEAVINRITLQKKRFHPERRLSYLSRLTPAPAPAVNPQSNRRCSQCQSITE